MTQELLYDKRGDVGWITFNRPQARNALTFAMYEGAGFVNVGLRKRYYRVSGADAYTMQRPARGGSA